VLGAIFKKELAVRDALSTQFVQKLRCCHNGDLLRMYLMRSSFKSSSVNLIQPRLRRNFAGISKSSSCILALSYGLSVFVAFGCLIELLNNEMSSNFTSLLRSFSSDQYLALVGDDAFTTFVFISLFQSVFAAKIRISERNTKEKRVFLFISERKYLDQGSRIRISERNTKDLSVSRRRESGVSLKGVNVSHKSQKTQIFLERNCQKLPKIIFSTRDQCRSCNSFNLFNLLFMSIRLIRSIRGRKKEKFV